jgi:hypothetical protein
MGGKWMNLGEYFQKAKGRVAVLATSDQEGKANVAVYATPHVIDERTVAFIMRDRLSHANLQANPHAAYLFLEDQDGYQGLRLYLTKVREEQDSDLLFALRRRESPADRGADKGPLFLVFFQVDRVLPLVGAGKARVELP